MQLSVILVSYNSKAVLEPCLEFLRKQLKLNFKKTNEAEIIIVDNHSQDQTAPWLRSQKDLRLIFVKENLGFGRANNLGLEIARGRFVLFLNTDVFLKKAINFSELFSFLDNNKQAAGLTIKLLLPNGKIDPASHRGFPTPYNALTYFTGLERLGANVTVLNRVFGGYHLTYRNLKTVHQIDSPTAAFFLAKKKIIDHLKGFDPDYFFYGEDLDLAYRIKQLGYAIWYYPKYQGTHLKYQSGKKSQNRLIRQQSQQSFYQSMLIFYNKHYCQKYPSWLSELVKLGIRLKSRFG